MPDKVLSCQNCHSPFVFSEFEQYEATKQNKNEPIYCPICQSLKNQEKFRPAKPKTRVI